MAELPPPGWYPDPEDARQQRYWDGQQWTDHRAPLAPQPPPGMPPQGHLPPVYGTRPAPTNGFAVASMVLGIVWIYWIGSILALVFGYVARRQIDESGGLQQGRGMAIAGIVLGWIGVGVLSLLVVFGVIGAIAGA